ncbi:MAG: hypothetical protein EXS10_08605 [Phycisphaerales bacterium]|nr:hypothetical protein [Phycisphaerales bacterium]
MSTTSTASAQIAHWSPESGGNGHWYCVVSFAPYLGWQAPHNYAESIGAHLVSLGTREERDFVFASIVNAEWIWFSSSGPFIGAVQDHNAPDFVEPDGGWRWIDGTPWTWNPWEDGPAPDGTCETADECVLRFANPNCDAIASSWCDDAPMLPLCPGCEGEIAPYYAVIEFEIDCDGNGLVDFGERLMNPSLDANQDGILDHCECRADLDQSGTIDSSDLMLLLNAWGTAAAPSEGDIDGDGVITGSDVVILLDKWGPCQSCLVC